MIPPLLNFATLLLWLDKGFYASLISTNEIVAAPNPLRLVSKSCFPALSTSYMHFFCKVTGFPAPNITWYKNDSAIRRLPWFTRLPVAGGEYLRLGSMRWYRHDGVYHCRASNEVGTATSKKSPLMVYKGSIGVMFCAHEQSSFSGFNA